MRSEKTWWSRMLGRVNGENQSVARALAVLNLLGQAAAPLGVREIARHLQLAPSNVQRLIKTLARAGFLEQMETTLRYAIGYRAFQVGNAFIGQNSLYSAAMPELFALADRHITGFLGVRRDRSVIYLASVHSEETGRHRPGSQTHLHSTAMGKALLAEMTDDEVRALLGDGPLPRLTPQTNVSLEQLMNELQIIRRIGFATSEEENRRGFFSAGAVIRETRGKAVAVISGAVPTSAVKAGDRENIGRLVLEAAKNASRKLRVRNGLIGTAPRPSNRRDGSRTAATRWT